MEFLTLWLCHIMSSDFLFFQMLSLQPLLSFRLSCRTKSWKLLSWGLLNWKALQKWAVLVKSRFGKLFIPDRVRVRDSGCLLRPVWVRGEWREKHWGTINKLGTLIGPTTDQKHAVSDMESYGKQEPRKKNTNNRTERRHKVNDTVVCIIGGPLETEVRKERFSPSLKSKHTKRADSPGNKQACNLMVCFRSKTKWSFPLIQIPRKGAVMTQIWLYFRCSGWQRQKSIEILSSLWPLSLLPRPSPWWRPRV